MEHMRDSYKRQISVQKYISYFAIHTRFLSDAGLQSTAAHAVLSAETVVTFISVYGPGRTSSICKQGETRSNFEHQLRITRKI